MICGPEDNAPEELNPLILPSETTPEEAAGKLLDENSPSLLVLRCADAAMAYGRIMSGFKQVNAAGGLVRSACGDFLMMFRNGVWDLPKGHQEKDEAIEATAVREIAEETAVSGLRRGELICITDHCYLREGIWHVKHTWWFDFFSPTETRTIPQTEEGISSVVWTRPEDIPLKLKNTYPSIREVFEKAMKLFAD